MTRRLPRPARGDPTLCQTGVAVFDGGEILGLATENLQQT